MIHDIPGTQRRKEQISDIGEIKTEEQQKETLVKCNLFFLQLQYQTEGYGEEVIGRVCHLQDVG